MTLIAETTIIATPTNTSTSSGISGGAVAGIVIGILALIAIGAAITFFVRRRRDEYQRQYDPSNLGSSPGSLNRPFGTDQRLEPQMLQKRESVGSLADENDYSRKILRVIS
jgi:cell wall integrity and stress response component